MPTVPAGGGAAAATASRPVKASVGSKVRKFLVRRGGKKLDDDEASVKSKILSPVPSPRTLPAADKAGRGLTTPTNESPRAQPWETPSGKDGRRRASVLDAQFLDAVRQGQAQVAKSLLKQGASRNSRTESGGTALHLACKVGELETLTVLARVRGMHLDAKDHAGNTALHVACTAGMVDHVKELLKSGVKPWEENHAREIPGEEFEEEVTPESKNAIRAMLHDTLRTFHKAVERELTMQEEKVQQLSNQALNQDMMLRDTEAELAIVRSRLTFLEQQARGTCDVLSRAGSVETDVASLEPTVPYASSSPDRTVTELTTGPSGRRARGGGGGGGDGEGGDGDDGRDDGHDDENDGGGDGGGGGGSGSDGERREKDLAVSLVFGGP